MNDTPDIHRLLPSDIEAEKGILGSFLTYPKEVGRLCHAEGIRSEHFHHPAHRIIFDTASAINDENDPVDVIIVTSALRSAGTLVEVGGAAYITELIIFAATDHWVKSYIHLVREKHILRKAIAGASQIVAAAYDDQHDVAGAVAKAQQLASTLADAHNWRRTHRKTNAEAVREIVADLRSGQREKVFGLPIGFPLIDAEIGGLMPGDLCLISGTPSSGKSALALQIADYFSREHKANSAYFGFEMTQSQNLRRLLQIRSGINLRESMTGERELNDATDARIDRAAAHVAESLITFLDDRSAYPDITALCREARAMHAQNPLGLIVLDYDELIPGIREKGGTKETELASIAFTLKSLAGELRCPAILLSQVTIGDKGTSMRGSSAKMQAGNICLHISTIEGDESRRKVTIWKARDSRRGESFTYGFYGKTTTFFEVDQDENTASKPAKKNQTYP